MHPLRGGVRSAGKNRQLERAVVAHSMFCVSFAVGEKREPQSKTFLSTF